MRRLILAFTCSMLIAGCGQQGDVQRSSHDLAKAATHAALEGGAFDALMEQATASSYAVVKARLEGAGQPLTTDQSQRLQASLRLVLREVYPREAWEEALTPVLLDSLERQELQQVVDFAETPFGQKVLALQARVATGGGAVGQRFMQSRQQELAKRLQAELVTILSNSR